MVVDVEVVLRNFGVAVEAEAKVRAPVLVWPETKVPLSTKLVPALAETVTTTVTVRVPPPVPGVLVAISEDATLRWEFMPLRTDAMAVAVEV